MKQTTKTQNLKNSNTLFKNVILKKSCPELVSGLFQDLAHDKILRQIPNQKLLLRHWQRFIGGQMLKPTARTHFARNQDFGKRRQVQHDKFPRVIARKCAFTLAESGQKRHVIACLTRDLPSWKCVKAQVAFTLAETLIALAVIGIVAALTIPGLVKNYNEHAWSTGKDVFTKRLDVALKEMNTDGTLTGYKTTAAFVNELKKNIKITQICTDDVTKCFAKNVKVRQYNGEVTLNNDNAIECETNAGQDWAENVGIRFANGVNAIISYNKNCTSDPYNNQFSPSAACIGIIYDVSGNKKPNASGKDIGTNANVVKVGGKAFCAFEFKYKDNDPVCFTKVLAPGEYNGFPMKIDGKTVTCNEAIGKYIESSSDSCDFGNDSSTPDYWAGAQYVCGGSKSKMASSEQLALLAKYLFQTNSISEQGGTYNLNETTFLEMLASTPFYDYYKHGFAFRIWLGAQYSSGFGAQGRGFFHDYTSYDGYGRDRDFCFAVCVE